MTGDPCCHYFPAWVFQWVFVCTALKANEVFSGDIILRHIHMRLINSIHTCCLKSELWISYYTSQFDLGWCERSKMDISFRKTYFSLLVIFRHLHLLCRLDLVWFYSLYKVLINMGGLSYPYRSHIQILNETIKNGVYYSHFYGSFIKNDDTF